MNRDPTLDPDLLHTYVDGWRRHDVEAVRGTLAGDCEVVETNGLVYRGSDRVGEWMRNWLAAGGHIADWRITDSGAAGDLLVAEWQRICRWQGEEIAVQGATVCRPLGGRISYLREYGGRAAP
ncbi:nuclear transport factor 2 family protein [Actinoplanes sp. NPDC026619]|uniref:nuclear transport factor 2 family protein n=1 Tax=Actinoplanes sp. NPDC026619 TaxID=3155798 RepID=UPI0033F46F3D